MEGKGREGKEIAIENIWFSDNYCVAFW